MSEESWISTLRSGGYAATNAVTNTSQMRWAIDGLLPRTGTSIWFGAGATGKTQLLLSMVAQLARPAAEDQLKWLGSNVNVSGRLLVLSAEDLGDDLERRLGGIVRSMEPDPETQHAICSRVQILPFLSMSQREFEGKNPCLFAHVDREWGPTQTLKELESYIESWNSQAPDEDKIIGVVMDSATSMAGFEMTNAEATTNFLFYLNRLCVRLDVFWAIIGHTLKETKFNSLKPEANAVARLRGSAMWSTTPRSVVEVRLALENEDLGSIQGVDLRDLVVVTVVKANSHRASRRPRYLKRVEGAAYEDLTEFGPGDPGGGGFSAHDVARLSAVSEMLTEMFAEARGARLSFRALDEEFSTRRARSPALANMDGKSSYGPGKGPHRGLSWCLQKLQDNGGLIYESKGFLKNDLGGALMKIEALAAAA